MSATVGLTPTQLAADAWQRWSGELAKQPFTKWELFLCESAYAAGAAAASVPSNKYHDVAAFYPDDAAPAVAQGDKP